MEEEGAREQGKKVACLRQTTSDRLLPGHRGEADETQTGRRRVGCDLDWRRECAA